MKEIIRNKDTKRVEYGYTYKKFSANTELINLEARNVFPNKATLSLLKCSIKFNHYAMRDIIINEKLQDDSYLRYNKKENWVHVI